MVLAKAKENPLTELPLRKGVFAPSGMRKPLPLGEVALRSNDGEGEVAKNCINYLQKYLVIGYSIYEWSV